MARAPTLEAAGDHPGKFNSLHGVAPDAHSNLDVVEWPIGASWRRAEAKVGGVVLRFPNQVERGSDLTGHYKRLVGAVYGERRRFVVCHVPFSTQAVQASAHS